MATFAARRLQPMIANTAHILGIELLAAAQGIEFLRPLEVVDRLEEATRLATCPVQIDRTGPLSGAGDRTCDTAGTQWGTVPRVPFLASRRRRCTASTLDSRLNQHSSNRQLLISTKGSW